MVAIAKAYSNLRYCSKSYRIKLYFLTSCSFAKETKCQFTQHAKAAKS